jgi:hypothetical protein
MCRREIRARLRSSSENLDRNGLLKGLDDFPLGHATSSLALVLSIGVEVLLNHD